MRRALTTLAAALALLGPAGPPAARAQRAEKPPEKSAEKPGQREVQAKIVSAMESFDLLEFEAARRQLGEAMVLATKLGLERDRIAARALLDLGIVEFAGLKNRDAARRAFRSAVAIDPKIEIGVAYRTDAMADLLIEVKQESGIDTAGAGKPAGDPVCAELEGVDHVAVAEARRGLSQPISAQVGHSVGAERMLLFYRRTGAIDYAELPMQQGSGCTYEASIPAAAMTGKSVEYFVAAIRAGRVVAGKGSMESPYVIALAGQADPDPSVEAPARRAARPRRFFASFALGTGGGYVSGTTEVEGTDVECCFAPALLHVFPEIGYFLSPRMSLSAAFRLGFAIGADVPGHATYAPAGLIRLRYALSPTGEGLLVSAAAGGGILRNTVEVKRMDGSGTDTAASGPFLFGAGLSYLRALSGRMRLVAELNTLVAFPAGVEEIGSCPGSGCARPHTGAQIDLNLGVLFAF